MRCSFAFLLLFFVFAGANETEFAYAVNKSPEKWDFSANIGLNIGGTMPFPLPSTIIKIKNYNPLFPALSSKFEMLHKPNGISVGAQLERKGMETTAKVKEYQINFGNFKGKFNGQVDTKMSAIYLGVPIKKHFAVSDYFSLNAGAFVTWMLSGEFTGAVRDGKLNDGFSNPLIAREEYDFSNQMNKLDWGATAGIKSAPFFERFIVSFDFTYGIASVFETGFDGISYDMQNIYANLSVGYLF
ncbi:hypothetical protein AGMMS49938_12300 [Fibrobacterales bacterium]|nr:hypothetical protein AGMMS49938_12300 [Fibrobacterales bacterium]